MAWTERYVDPSFSTNGDGTAATEASGAGLAGAWTSIENAVAGGWTGGQRLNCKASAEDTLSADSTLPTGTAAAPVAIRGYTTTPGDGGVGGYVWESRTGNNRPTFGNFTLVESVTLDLSTRIWEDGNRVMFDRCRLPLATPSNCVACFTRCVFDPDLFSTSNGGFLDIAGGVIAYCYLNKVGNTTTPDALVRATASFCGGAVVGNVLNCNGSSGIQVESGVARGLIVAQNSIYNAADGIFQDNEDPSNHGGVIANNLIWDCSGYGISIDTGSSNGLSIPLGTNAIGGATSGRLNPSLDDVALSQDVIELTQNPFTDPENEDFSLNNSAGGGELAKAAAAGAIAGGITNPASIGAYQVEGGASGGSGGWM